MSQDAPTFSAPAGFESPPENDPGNNNSQAPGAFTRFRKRLSTLSVTGTRKKHPQEDSDPANGESVDEQPYVYTATPAAAAGEDEEAQAPAVPSKDITVPKRKASTRKSPTVPLAAPVPAPAPAPTPATTTGGTHYLNEPHMPSYSPSTRSLLGPKPSLRELYPSLEPYASGTLSVEGGLHSIYWELSGKKGGKPVVFLHGGPGGGTSGDDRRWFDPETYQILVFDQRGAGRSTPSASLEKNTTWSLIEDIEQLRVYVAGAPEKWHVFGGSWGSTLALAYAQTHPERVSALILRGIFTLRRSELEFFYQEGASHLFPDLFARYRDLIPEAERGDLIGAYHRRLTGDDEGVMLEAAKRWSQWEDGTCKLYVPIESLSKGDLDKRYLEFARIECHYFQNRGFFESDDYLLSPAQLSKIAHIPTTIVQGRYDVVCPAKSSWDLHVGLPEARYVVIPDAGHSAKEPGIRDALLKACDEYRGV
ncbi:unnamed protein product [Tilletia controversa]|uniref:Proline iminopeptidase n=3 Tax=Tilletia TaxID=13289 RepID=A0A8X7SUK7_9BASI|nr:hypothetical protein CF328_g6554 [Tilletia controversa]KAE8188662.1 hypothetical protein CF336_g6057 [Tilletia laevis]KAE8260085.1 hypothetical protein A4X03_0g3915 [Tilletia caries]KAE8195356.1 hypothetical protein CF335_g5115 [Tilletia laevis]KAE8242528.1 hypothetical protein A4X06_0g6865 [Tilletia controversa]